MSASDPVPFQTILLMHQHFSLHQNQIKSHLLAANQSTTQQRQKQYNWLATG